MNGGLMFSTIALGTQVITSLPTSIVWGSNTFLVRGEIALPKWVRWFDKFRVALDVVMPIATVRASTKPSLSKTATSLLQKLRWKRRRYIQNLMAF